MPEIDDYAAIRFRTIKVALVNFGRNSWSSRLHLFVDMQYWYDRYANTILVKCCTAAMSISTAASSQLLRVVKIPPCLWRTLREASDFAGAFWFVSHEWRRVTGESDLWIQRLIARQRTHLRQKVPSQQKGAFCSLAANRGDLCIYFQRWTYHRYGWRWRSDHLQFCVSTNISKMS